MLNQKAKTFHFIFAWFVPCAFYYLFFSFSIPQFHSKQFQSYYAPQYKNMFSFSNNYRL